MSFSPTQIAIILAVFTVYVFLKWKKRPKTPLPHLRAKQVSVKGVQLKTRLTKDTPLICLINDGLKFGPDFRDKEIPELPEGCECDWIDVSQASRDWFSARSPHKEGYASDLGLLTYAEGCYYKYSLVLRSEEIGGEEARSYRDLCDRLNVDEVFKDKIRNHFGDEIGQINQKFKRILSNSG